MKLSICIPVFQCDVRDLINDLVNQAKNCLEEIELILLDDGSDAQTKQLNKGLGELDGVSYHELPQNTGRSNVRNALCAMANGEYVMFLDSDSGIETSGFLEVYLRYIKQVYSVLYGGRSYGAKPESGKELRWLFGVERESKLAKFRQRDMYRYFLSNNFVISKSLIRQLKFDSDIKGYGYEDSVLAARLAEFEIDVKHSYNPVQHTVYETNDRFIDQTNNAIRNLVQLRVKEDPAMHTIAMLRVRGKLGPMSKLFSLLYRMIGDRVERNLRKKIVSLWWFDLYRFSLLCSLSNV
jgi:glycosyltransferase involved in cell wall biosynthesis